MLYKKINRLVLTSSLSVILASSLSQSYSTALNDNPEEIARKLEPKPTLAYETEELRPSPPNQIDRDLWAPVKGRAINGKFADEDSKKHKRSTLKLLKKKFSLARASDYSKLGLVIGKISKFILEVLQY